MTLFGVTLTKGLVNNAYTIFEDVWGASFLLIVKEQWIMLTSLLHPISEGVEVQVAKFEDVILQLYSKKKQHSIFH
ncbi:hypothetical protein RRF57_002388 [Xylaria bambusicola]|uniref:Uncharacterized protein n=1 Tax=Xylaria bambusicola TaxID=326684 RepID=A0AAN7UEH7_9PEZI